MESGAEAVEAKRHRSTDILSAATPNVLGSHTPLAFLDLLLGCGGKSRLAPAFEWNRSC